LYCSEALAKGANYHTKDRYNPQQIAGLPLVAWEKVLNVCSALSAMHAFATYSDNMRQLVLHDWHFYCDPQHTYCKSSSQCPHQVYVSAGGYYKLIRSYYGAAD
jgi:hypothetical protein